MNYQTEYADNYYEALLPLDSPLAEIYDDYINLDTDYMYDYYWTIEARAKKMIAKNNEALESFDL